MNAGVGYATSQDPFECGRRAIEAALSQTRIPQPTLLLAFSSGALDASAVERGIRSVVGPHIPVVGGSAVGVITNQDLSYEGSLVGVAAIQVEGPPPTVASVSGIERDEYAAGRHLGERMGDTSTGSLLLMFYDSIKVPPTDTTPPVMNASPPLIAGIESALDGRVPVVGAGVLGDYGFGPTWQYCGTGVARQSVVGALIQEPVKPYVQIMHGCTPKDGVYHTITRMEGQVVHELNGRPAADLIDTFYGDRSWRTQRPVKRLALGVNHGDPYGDLREEVFVNRLISGALPDSNSIVLFEPDLAVGTEVLFMLRDGKTMIESARDRSRALMQQILADGRKPGFGLYIDCAGRAAAQSDTHSEEAAEVQGVLNQHGVPLLGFYSGVEVAPLLGRSRGLDWTGVLLVLTEA
jgi:hypothetical protein